ncbi:MAG: tRNA 2-thiocytidine(32) synthetase TtcA, partial [Oscillospiraceae bacterium]|nr:tRNA 2-thiocytidine(32) synthetase TtcA [Oscillospiraceae bacterium]
KNELNIVKSKCPADGHTNREVTKQFNSAMDKSNKGFSDRIIGAMRRANIDGWGGVNWTPKENK